MTFYYLDTNALVKLMIREKGHDQIRKIYDKSDTKFIISELSITEVHSALAQKVCRQEITDDQFEDAISAFSNMVIGSKKFLCIKVNENLYSDALPLIKKYKTLRTLDSLHLVTALEYKSLELTFITSDRKLKKAAEGEGLICLSMDECICPVCGEILKPSKETSICDKCGHKESRTKMSCEKCGHVCDSCNVIVCEKYHDLKAI